MTGCLAAPGSDDPSERAETVFAFNEPELVIPDDEQTSVTDSVAIEGSCVIGWIEVDVEIAHPWRGDLQLTLMSPSGTQVMLKAFDAPDDGSDVRGSYPSSLTPFESLSRVFLEDGRGEWQIEAFDMDDESQGTLMYWGITLECMN